MGKKPAKIIAYVLLVLAVVGSIGLIAKFTNGFTSDFKTFYVSVDGTDVLADTGGFVLKPGEGKKVDIHYTFQRPEDEARGYSVKVVPNPIEGKDFDIIMDSTVYSYQNEKNLTPGFDISRQADFFIIQPKGNFVQVLQAVYPEAHISNCDQHIYLDMFSLIITSYDGKESIALHFSIAEGVKNVVLDPKEVVF